MKRSLSTLIHMWADELDESKVLTFVATPQCTCSTKLEFHFRSKLSRNSFAHDLWETIYLYWLADQTINNKCKVGSLNYQFAILYGLTSPPLIMVRNHSNRKFTHNNLKHTSVWTQQHCYAPVEVEINTNLKGYRPMHKYLGRQYLSSWVIKNSTNTISSWVLINFSF